MFHDLTWSSNVLDTCGKVEYITSPVKGPLRTCGGGGRNPPEHFMPPFNIVFKRQNEATFYLKWAFYNTYFESKTLHLNKADKRLFLGPALPYRGSWSSHWSSHGGCFPSPC